MSSHPASASGDLAALAAAVTARLAEVVDVTGDPGDRLEVRAGDLGAAFGCAAADAMDGPSPFVASPGVAGWATAATMVDRLVHGHLDPHRGRPPADPATAFRSAWWEGEQLDGWNWRWLRDEATRAERTLTVADATRRVAALARGLGGEWPPPTATLVGHTVRWTTPDRGVRLHGRVDVVLGRRVGGHRLVVALAGAHGPSTRARLAYEALVETLVLRRPPAEVLGILPDSGRRYPVAVDHELLGEGVAAAADAAAVAAARRRRDPGALPRRPGSRCRTCPHAATCAEGSAWLAGPGRRRHGFLPPAEAVP